MTLLQFLEFANLLAMSARDKREEAPAASSPWSAAMEDEMDLLPVPQSFEFPYPPYSIQQDFMSSLFTTLERGGLGVFESPTGTVSVVLNVTPLLVVDFKVQ